MVTAIYSLSRVNGAAVWLLYWLAGVLAYLGICFIIKSNRTGKGIRTILIGLLIAEAVTDLLWGLIYYPRGSYVNYGVRGVFGILLWIPILIVTFIIVTKINKIRR